MDIEPRRRNQEGNLRRLRVLCEDARGANVPASPVQRPGGHLAQGRRMVYMPRAWMETASEGRDGILNLPSL